MTRLQLAAIVASLAGVGVSIYLTFEHYAGVVPGCPVTGPINCDAVLSSPYAVIAGTSVPTSAAGIVWFVVSAALWMRPVGRLQVAWAAVGMLTVVYLLYVEIVRVGAICLWCTAAHVLVVFLLIAALSAANRPRAY